MSHVWLAFWFFLPAGMSNMAPVLGNKIPGWNQWKTPLDLGHTYKGQRIFGTNKSWRGLVSGVLLSSLLGWLIFPHLDIHLSFGNFILLGGASGAGALIGDAVESFFKRQAGVKPGHSWFPFDQLDYIVGGILFSLPFIRLQLIDYLLIVVWYFGLHLLSSYVGFRLGFKEKPI